MKKNTFDSNLIWDEVKQDIDKESGYLIFDDTLIDKPYSEKIELTKWQWSGKHHAVKKGIGLTNCLWLNQNGLSMPVDYRIYNKDEDSKTKNDHFLEMLNACEEKGLKPSYVLIDSWFSSKKNLKTIARKGWFFIADIKVNRKVSEIKGTWISIRELDLAEKQVKKVWLKDFGYVLIMKREVKGEKVKYTITNDLNLLDYDEFQDKGEKRWALENLHRGLKQLCGLEKSYMRKAQAQKNHIFCSIRAFTKLEIFRFKRGISWYQQKCDIVRDAVRAYLLSMSFA